VVCTPPRRRRRGKNPSGHKKRNKRGGVWYSRRLVVYSADKGPCGHKRRIETRRRVVFTPPRCLRRERGALGGHKKGKDTRRRAIRTPPRCTRPRNGKRRRGRNRGHHWSPLPPRRIRKPRGTTNNSSFPLHILPSSPPLLAVAPDPFSLPSYMPFESVTWRCWGASLGSLGAGDVASGGGDVALFAAFFDGVGGGL